MKRVTLALMVLLVFPVLVYSQRIWIPFTSGVPGASPIIKVLESHNSRTVIQITIPGMWIEDTLIDGITYHILTIPDHSTMYNIGAPQLPAIRELVAIPPTSNVNILITTANSLILSDYMVYPYQTPVPVGQPPGPFIIDTLIYSMNDFYPQVVAEINDPAIWRDMRIVKSSCYPISFNPVKRELNICYDFTIELRYQGTSSINPLLYGYPSIVDPMVDAMYRSLIVNYDWLGILTERSSLWDYLVITATEYYDDLQDFVFWKHKKGLEIKVARPKDIVKRPYFIQGDTLAIKNYIRNTFISDVQFSYVLLVGDENAVPMYNEWQSQNQRIYSDHYYACFIGYDDYPDIAIGRLSVASSEDVNTIVNKIFAYERTPAQDWAIGRIEMVSHWQQSFHNINAWIIANILIPKGFYCYDIWGELGYTNQDIKNYIENGSPNYRGVSIVNYYGHGLQDKWNEWNYTQSFTTTDVHSLTNPNHYPIVYNCCCWNGAIQEDYEVMVEAWTRDPDGGGVGALGASRPAWAIVDDPIPKDLFIATFDKSIYDVGYAINYAKNCLIRDYGNAGLENARMYNWFGDPELSIWTCATGCSTMIVTHPTRITTEPNDFTVTVQYQEPGPVKWALVCLYKDESPELWRTLYTNSNGQATFMIDPVCSGILHVTVTKHNYKPYEGECQVREGKGTQTTGSSPSIPRNYALDQNTPNPFCGSTVIPYQIPAKGNIQCISIKIYDINGKRIRTLVNRQQSAGYYTTSWDGYDDSGKRLPSGVYFLKLIARDYSATEKLLLIR